MQTNTLYISDLDGTLLAPDGYISENSVNILNKLIHNGAKISIATSRNLFAFKQRVPGVDFSIPVILNTGACIYDCKSGHYKDIISIPFPSLIQLKETLDAHQIASFIYGLNNEELYLVYEHVFDKADQTYIKKRGPLYHTETMSLQQLKNISKDFKAIFLVGYGPQEKIQKIHELILASHIPGIKDTISKDVYTENYFIEFTESSVSKASAILKLKNMLDVDEIVAFGDNTNDTDMLKLADRCYVPENGLDEIKKIADAVIEGNETDSVARFIEQDS